MEESLSLIILSIKEVDMILLENEIDIMEKIYLWLVQYSPTGQMRVLEWVRNRLYEYNQENCREELKWIAQHQQENKEVK